MQGTLYALWPAGLCNATGLGGAAGTNVSLTTLLSAAVNASNAPSDAEALNAIIAEQAGACVCVCVGVCERERDRERKEQ